MNKVMEMKLQEFSNRYHKDMSLDFSNNTSYRGVYEELTEKREFRFLPNEYGDSALYNHYLPYTQKYTNLETIYRHFNDNPDLSFDEFKGSIEEAFIDGLRYSVSKFNRYSKDYNNSTFGEYFITINFLEMLLSLSIEKALSSKTTESEQIFFEGKLYNELSEIFEDKKAVSPLKTARGFINRVSGNESYLSQPMIAYCLYTKNYRKEFVSHLMTRRAKTPIECRLAETAFYRNIDAYIGISIERQRKMLIECEYIKEAHKEIKENSLTDVFINFNNDIKMISDEIRSDRYIPYNIFKDMFKGKEYIQPTIERLIYIGKELESRNYIVFDDKFIKEIKYMEKGDDYLAQIKTLESENRLYKEMLEEFENKEFEEEGIEEEELEFEEEEFEDEEFEEESEEEDELKKKSFERVLKSLNKELEEYVEKMKREDVREKDFREVDSSKKRGFRSLRFW